MSISAGIVKGSVAIVILYVYIGRQFKHSFYNVEIPLARRHVKRGGAVMVVFYIDTRALVKKQPGDVVITASHCQHERCITVRIGDVRIGVVIEQETHHLRVTAVNRNYQRSLLIDCLAVEICSFVDKKSQSGDGTVGFQPVEFPDNIQDGRAAFRVRGVYIGSLRKQIFHH